MTADFASYCRPCREASLALDALAQARVEASLQRAEARLSAAAQSAPGVEALESLTGWLSARKAWEDLGEPRRMRLRMQPAFRYFVHGMHRVRGDEALLSFSRHLPALLWAAALDAGIAWRSRILLDYRGGVRAPGYARYTEFGADRAHQAANLILHEDSAAFAFADGLLVRVARDDVIGAPDDQPSIPEHGYAIRTSARAGRCAFAVETRDPWLRVRLTGTNQRTDGADFEGADDLRYEDDPSVAHIEAALGLIDQVWPEAMDDLAHFVHAIVPFRTTPQTHQAFTVSSRQGAIFLGEAPTLATAESIIHEAAHVKLRQIQLLDPLLADPLDESLRVTVPWRPDPRPIPGVFEGVFVFAHVAELMRRIAQIGEAGAERRYAEVRRDLKTGADLVRAHARLTAAGERFFAALCEWARI